MKKIVIEGPAKLNGSINLQGSKNALLINLVLPILTEEECVISNVSHIKDVDVTLSILKSLGATVSWVGSNVVSIRCNGLFGGQIDPETALRTSSSKFFIPLLVKRFGEVSTGRSLGDNIGLDRGFSKFVKQMEEIGISHEKKGDVYKFYSRGGVSKYQEIHLSFPSFSATVGTALAHVLGKGVVVIQNAHVAPEIINAFEMLKSMGARLIFEGSTVTVEGVEKLNGTRFRNQSDRNALVTYVVASLISNGEVTLSNVDDAGLEPFWAYLNRIGANYQSESGNVVVHPSLESLKPDDVFAFLLPDFHSDWQPLVGALMTQINGVSTIVDDLWENRLRYWQELSKMGAKYELFKPNNSRFRDDAFHGVKIFGKTKLHGAKVIANDVRGGASLVLAALAADGKTVIENIEQIERGYEDIVGVLSLVGANIRYED